MTRMDLHAEATAFFDDFVSAFARFDGQLIATRYLTPYLAMHADGSSDLFAEQQEIGAYFQRVIDAYHQQGCRSCRYSQLEVVPMGSNCLLATVTWQLLSQDDRVVSGWRESYNLLRTAEGLRVFASVDHASHDAA